ncbi:hypothetical protein BJF79_27175 [Actinomadura sp. CNU-125]|nr:hypothetical protein [Actinomadura sp. CNU-125]OLT38308.1 hypothetical protein BJF79_27175 [Actinomadura sp. CNU-125]
MAEELLDAFDGGSGVQEEGGGGGAQDVGGEAGGVDAGGAGGAAQGGGLPPPVEGFAVFAEDEGVGAVAVVQERVDQRADRRGGRGSSCRP